MKEIKWRKVEEGLPEEVLHEDEIKGEGASDDVLVRTALVSFLSLISRSYISISSLGHRSVGSTR